MSRYIAIIIVMLLLFTGCSEDNGIDITDKTEIATINYKNDTYRAYKGIDASSVHIFKNNKYQEDIEVADKSVQNKLELPKVNTGKNLEKSEEITNYTYKSSIVQSLEYIIYLEENGYEKILEALTPRFYEVYMKDEDSTYYKRLIITSKYIIEYNTDKVEFDIKNYIIPS